MSLAFFAAQKVEQEGFNLEGSWLNPDLSNIVGQDTNLKLISEFMSYSMNVCER